MVNINLVNKKKAVSEVIATVLIILIVITTITIITPTLINFVNSKLKAGQSCFDTLGKLSFDEGGYACSNDTGTYAQIKIGDIDISEIKVVVYKTGSSNPIIIKNGSVEDVEMLGGSMTIELPPKQGSRTYLFKCNACKNAESASLVAVIDGKDCDQAADITTLSRIC